MGIMAGRAVGFSHGIIHVLFHKGRGVGFMALCTEGNQIVFQKMVCLHRPVGFVAVEAPLLNGIVFKFDLCDGVPQGFMATEAEIVPGFQEIRLVLRTMGIVALDTISFHGNLVAAFCLLGNDIFVTLEADTIGVVIKQFPMGRGMGIVAFRAFAILHRGMDKLPLELLLKFIMTIQAELPRRPHLQFELVLLRMSQRKTP